MTKKTTNLDPFYTREKQKYAHPIPSREFIIEHLEKLGAPESYNKLARACELKDKKSCQALRWRLNAMLRDGQLLTDRKGRYALVKKMAMVSGYVICHKDGYGFLVPDDGSQDVFLSPRQMRTLLPGDRVLVNLVASNKQDKKEGMLVEILERGFTRIVGRYTTANNLAVVIPVNKSITQEIVIPPLAAGSAKVGQFVVVEITRYPTQHSGIVGKVVEILGKNLLPRLEIEIVINAHGLPNLWSDEVRQEVKPFAKSKISHSGRQELQHLPFVTIDGEDAKDFDDALYCEPIPKGGWVLYVAIADVAHYVDFDSALDREAFTRGNSVYFPGYVVPMLPEVLSNELCSLKPEVERLVMICEIEISKTGKIEHYKFYEAVIKSWARLTYDQVFNLLEEKPASASELLPYLKELHKLYSILLAQRKARGALDFSRVEVKIIFNEKLKVQALKPVSNHYVHGIVEECMLAANVCAAKFLQAAKMPALYRVHVGPDLTKLRDLRVFLKSLKLELKGGASPQPKHYAELLKDISGRSDEHLIQTVLLRSLRQAVYTSKESGHFGLAYDNYLHFTSPIRRYPDLVNHRAIKHLLHFGKAKNYSYSNLTIQNFAAHCSLTERRADDAAHEVEDWLKCEFMKDKIGKTFKGIISGVASFGVFVEIKDIFVEGLVHISSLKSDYYRFDPLHYRLVGKRSGIVYQLGDPIKVLVTKVDLYEREIIFELGE